MFHLIPLQTPNIMVTFICANITMMEKTNETNESAKDILATAMTSLMRTTPVENITVREICEAAGFSRQTFYRCFADKYDLINWRFDILLIRSFDQMGSGKTIYEGLVKKFEYIKDEYIFFRAAFASDTQNNLRVHDYDMIFAFYQNLLHEKGMQNIPSDILDILDMYCWASVYMTVKWVMQELPYPPQKLAETMMRAMPYELAEVYRKLGILK